MINEIKSTTKIGQEIINIFSCLFKKNWIETCLKDTYHMSEQARLSGVYFCFGSSKDPILCEDNEIWVGGEMNILAVPTSKCVRHISSSSKFHSDLVEFLVVFLFLRWGNWFWDIK